MGEEDATYSTRTSYQCLDSKARLCTDPPPPFLQKFLARDAVAGGYYWGHGSTALRVIGRGGGKCVFEALSEVEGAGVIRHCEVHLPMTAWAGLAGPDQTSTIDAPFHGIESYCTRTGTCSVVGLGTDLCSAHNPAPPTCEHLIGGSPGP